jgi:hypothetical protein
MKRIIITAAAAVTIAANAFGQVPLTLGVRAGYNNNSLYAIKNASVKTQNGFNVGAYAEYAFTDMLGIQSGVSLTTHGAKTRGYYDATPSKISIYELQIPVLAAFQYGIATDLKVKANAGVTFGIGLSAKGTGMPESNLYSRDVLKRFNFGLAAGAGIEWQHIYLGAAVDWGLSNINAVKTEPKTPVKTLSWSVNVGYSFDLAELLGGSGSSTENAAE